MAPTRSIEDAPEPMRQELIDLVFALAEQNPRGITEERMHRIISQSLGVLPSGQPYGGYRRAAGREMGRAEWTRVYDLVCRLWPEFKHADLTGPFREGVNRIFAAYGVAWDLGEDGHVQRVLPPAALAQVHAALAELRDVRYAPALELFNAAKDAYDDRPRRDRDSCANIFDAMESVAKAKYQFPNATFGQAVARLRSQGGMNDQILGVLESINTLRNKNFGHGMADPFNLTPAAVDFTYLTCIGGILLLARTP